ncbi:hypothetical protein MKW94_006618 [Papaver nudicaule]|uniref:Uncharacterized protein n=1 Tax=Papaver nudicaule TaxID=74823 RepID=A0AA41S4F0_PAPNU|nr:hypothetical protein [Papaver nudicaule]
MKKSEEDEVEYLDGEDEVGYLFKEDEVEYSDKEDEGYASSISYCYSEEEACDISADISERRAPDLKVYSPMKPLQHQTLSSSQYLDDDDPELPLAVNVDVKEVDAFELSKHKDIWMKTWPKRSEKVSVNVYGYFHEEELQFGGHAVIVRDMPAKPITASAQFSRFGLTYLDHVLMGIEDGLELAFDHGCSSPNVLCNSRLVVQLLNNIIVSDSCRCEIKTGGTICETCTLNNVSPLIKCYFVDKKYYFRNVEPSLEAVQGLRGSSTFEWNSGKNRAAHYLAKRVKANAEYSGSPFYKAVIEEPENFPYGLVDILLKDAYDAGFYNLDEITGIEVSKASTGNPSEDGDMAWDNILRDLRNGNAIVMEANGKITSNAGTQVVLSSMEEVTTTAKGVQAMAEKGQGGDDVVNSSAGDQNGGKAISAGNSITNATVVVSNKVQTNRIGSKVVITSLEETKDGKTVKDSNTVEARTVFSQRELVFESIPLARVIQMKR